MTITKSNWQKIIATLLAFVAIGFTAWFFNQEMKLAGFNPSDKQNYYKIFKTEEILDGSEQTAYEVVLKLDKRLNQYRKEFSKMAGTSDSYKLRALFFMNFVQMYGYYFERDLPQKQTFKHLLWNTRANNCGSNTILLSMLLDKAGYDFRTISINEGSHGYVEVRFKKKWHILDPTTNVWIDKSTDELIHGTLGKEIPFFLQADDEDNDLAREHTKRGYDVVALREQMLKIGQDFKVNIDRYNYIDLSGWKY